jgi:LemA protein
VFAGRNEVKGRAWSATPLHSQRTSTPTIWWDYQLEEERTHTRTVTSTDANGHTRSHTETYRQWHEIEAAADALDAFDVVDRSGAVSVRLSGADVVPRDLHDAVFEQERDAGQGFLGRLFDNRTGRYRESERGIAIGDELFVVGQALLDEARCTPVLSDALVSTRSEQSHTATLGGILVPLVVLASAASGLGIAMLVSSGEPGPGAIALGAAAPVLGLAVGWSVTTYNRLRLLGQSIDRARSLIDVQLTRRHDLIPALTAVVAAQVSHDRAVLTGAARRPPRSGSTTAPAMAEVASQQTAELRALLARAEALPELKEDESFRDLQRELADTESRITSSQAFYNDSLTLLRTRCETFPASLVARLVPLRTEPLLPSDAFERTVPALERTFA